MVHLGKIMDILTPINMAIQFSDHTSTPVDSNISYLDKGVHYVATFAKHRRIFSI